MLMFLLPWEVINTHTYTVESERKRSVCLHRPSKEAHKYTHSRRGQRVQCVISLVCQTFGWLLFSFLWACVCVWTCGRVFVDLFRSILPIFIFRRRIQWILFDTWTYVEFLWAAPSPSFSPVPRVCHFDFISFRFIFNLFLFDILSVRYCSCFVLIRCINEESNWRAKMSSSAWINEAWI